MGVEIPEKSDYGHEDADIINAVLRWWSQNSNERKHSVRNRTCIWARFKLKESTHKI